MSDNPNELSPHRMDGPHHGEAVAESSGNSDLEASTKIVSSPTTAINISPGKTLGSPESPAQTTTSSIPPISSSTTGASTASVNKADLAFVRALESELRALASDAKRKYSNVREKAEAATLRLKELMDMSTCDAVALQGVPELVQAFVLACAIQGNHKLGLRSVSSLHLLLTRHAVSSELLDDVITSLEKQAAEMEDATTIKVLQALISLLTSRDYRSLLGLHGLSRCIQLLLSLRSKSTPSVAAGNVLTLGSSATGMKGTLAGSRGASGSATTSASKSGVGVNLTQVSGVASCANAESSNAGGVIEQTVEAGFRQVSTDIFACAKDASSSSSIVFTMEEIMDQLNKSGFRSAARLRVPQDQPSEVVFASILFQDFCSLLASAEVCILRNCVIRFELVMDLLEDALMSGVFGSTREMRDLLSSKLCPPIHSLIRVFPDNRLFVYRLLRVILILVERFFNVLAADTEIFLVRLAKMVEASDELIQAKASRSTGMPSVPSTPSVAGVTKDLGQVCIQWFAAETLRVIMKRDHGLFLATSFDIPDDSVASPVDDIHKVKIMQTVILACVSNLTYMDFDPERLPFGLVKNDIVPFGNLGTTTGVSEASAGTSLCIVYSSLSALVSCFERQQPNAVLIMESIFPRNAEAFHRMMEELLWRLPYTESCDILGLHLDALRSMGHLYVQTPSMRNDVCDLLSLICNFCLKYFASSSSEKQVYKARLDKVVPCLSDVVMSVAGNIDGATWVQIIKVLLALEKDKDTQHLGFVNDFFSKACRLQCEYREALIMAMLGAMGNGEASFKDASVMVSEKKSGFVSSLTFSSASSTVTDLAIFSLSKHHPTIFCILRSEELLKSWFAMFKSKEETQFVRTIVWDQVTRSFVQLGANSDDAALRELAVLTLGRLVSKALEARDKEQPREIISQEKLLSPLNDLLSSSYSDTQANVLRSIHILLDACGEILQGDGAWSRILLSLQRASGIDRDVGSPSGPTVGAGAVSTGGSVLNADSITQIGFKSVQLIGGDFLPYLPVGALTIWIKLLGHYGSQDEDINVSLTALGLLWRTADYIAKSFEENISVLWICLFDELKKLGASSRPEVRNGAIRTLAGTCAAHGAQLDGETWTQCFRNSFIPLMSNVMTTNTEGLLPAGNLGVLGPTETLMATNPSKVVMHHTRDTPQKQWNETRVLALAGIPRVVRLYVAKLGELSSFESDIWSPLLEFARVGAGFNVREVAYAGVSAFMELLIATCILRHSQITGDHVSILQASRYETSETANLRQEKIQEPTGSVLEDASFPNSSSRANTITKDGDRQQGWFDKQVSSDFVFQIPGLFGVLDSEGSTKEEYFLSGGNVAVETVNAMWKGLWTVIGESAVEISDSSALCALSEGFSLAKKYLAQACSESDWMLLTEILFQVLYRKRLPNWKDTWSWPGITEVQVSVMNALESLDFGDSKTETWNALISNLLDLLKRGTQGTIGPDKSTNGAEAESINSDNLAGLPKLSSSPVSGLQSIEITEALVRRAVGTLRLLYDRDALPRSVKASNLEQIIKALHPLMSYQKQIEKVDGVSTGAPSSASVSAATYASIDASPIEQAGLPLWCISVQAFVVAVEHGMTVEGVYMPGFWKQYASIVRAFLFQSEESVISSFSTSSGGGNAAGSARKVVVSNRMNEQLRESFDVLLVDSILGVMKSSSNAPSESVSLILDQVLKPSALQGLTRSSLARAAQRCLLTMAQPSWPYPVDDAKKVTANHRAISQASVQAVADISIHVLTAYVIDSKRSGRCPLPSSRRSEAIFLLQGLETICTNDYRPKSQDATNALLAQVHSCLCQCIECKELAIRRLAKSLLEQRI